MDIYDSAMILAAVLTLAHILSIALAAWRCRPAEGLAIAPANAPGVTIVRPLRGVESHSSETLEAALRLTYPQHEVLFCVADANDPVIPLVHAAMAARPDVDVRLLIGVDRVGANPKLNNMAKGWREAKYEWIGFADSNLLTPPDYIERLMATWRPGTGAVSAPPAGSDPAGFWGAFECAFLNTFEARWQYAVDTLGHGFCQGKTLFIHRSLLGARGLAPLAEEPAEDAALTRVVQSRGLRVRLVSPPFPQPLGARKPLEVWARQVRWARLRRATFPLHYAPEILLGFVPAAFALGVAAFGRDWSIAGALGALFVAWYGAEALLAAIARWPLTWASLPAWALRDLIMPALWCAAWAGDGFSWHGATLTAGDPGREAQAR